MIPSTPNPVNPVNPVKSTPSEPRIATTHELMLPFAADLVRQKADGNSHGQMVSWLHAQGVYATLAEIASFWPYHALQKQKPPQQPIPPRNPVNPVSRQSFSDGGCQHPCRAIMSAEASAKGEAQGATADQKPLISPSNNPSTKNSQPLTINKTPSEAQIAANRLNAQKSTGPRTEAGKAIVSRNGEKHTKLSRRLLVSSQSHQESSSEFRALCDEYYASLDPVGPLEEMLVERIVRAVWRMSRADQAESGEIALNLEKGSKKDHPIDFVPTVLQAAEMLNQADVLQILEKSVPGCEYVLAHLRDARAAFSRDHRLTEETYKTLNNALRGRGLKVTAPLIEMALAFETNPNKIDPASLLQLHQTEMLDFFDRQIQYYEGMLATRAERPDAEARARQDAAMLPAGHALERILRYETVLERQLFSSMAQLEKLQSRRRSNDSQTQ